MKMLTRYRTAILSTMLVLSLLANGYAYMRVQHLQAFASLNGTYVRTIASVAGLLASDVLRGQKDVPAALDRRSASEKETLMMELTVAVAVGPLDYRKLREHDMAGICILADNLDRLFPGRDGSGSVTTLMGPFLQQQLTQARTDALAEYAARGMRFPAGHPCAAAGTP